jgi:hypothetical protein
MPVHQREAAASSTSPLFGGAPYETYAPSQGSVYLYENSDCNSRLSESATPLLAGSCLNMPIEGIKAISINSLPDCPNYGSPILLVSNVVDCKNSTVGASADGGVPDQCQAISSGVDIGSIEFNCYGSGISSVNGGAAQTSTAIQQQSSAAPTQSNNPGSGSTNSGSDDDDDDNGGSGCCSCECCCCCTVM